MWHGIRHQSRELRKWDKATCHLVTGLVNPKDKNSGKGANFEMGPWNTWKDEEDICCVTIDVIEKIKERDLDTDRIQSFMVIRCIPIVAGIRSPQKPILVINLGEINWEWLSSGMLTLGMRVISAIAVICIFAFKVGNMFPMKNKTHMRILMGGVKVSMEEVDGFLEGRVVLLEDGLSGCLDGDKDSEALADLSQIFMASRTDPQPSTQTVDTSDTSEGTSEEPTPIVEEPPDHKTPELQGELQHLIELSNWTLRDISLGEIHMFTHTALDKLCATQRVFTKMIRKGRKYDRTTSAKLIQQLRQIADEVHSDADIESIFSEQEDVNQPTTFMIQDSNDSSSSLETSDYSGPDLPSEAYQSTKKYSKPVPAIAYFDTGAHSTMMNPRVLPPEAWKEKSNEFLSVDGQIVITKLVSRKKIGIQFFPFMHLVDPRYWYSPS
ncbi:hypothetical protein Ddye_002268 [Dipteronia dyeriana]|uniref:Uncharacterized protein n=1 Tax=Dipteronia dyeriana TaxID=168575 RepID=A0AAD9XQ63_9ROSI|nr:hypothetical protein Ddye_002268 [Dipteronia dyeriana]